MIIALAGSTGMLGSKLAAVMTSRGHRVLSPDLQELDLNAPPGITRYFSEHRFDAFANCAAYTAVDDCEKESEYPKAHQLNATAVEHLAMQCREHKRLLIHFSTDYVFNGMKDSPYTEDDAPDPINAYGKTKLAGEQAIRRSDCSCYLIRTSWLYGPNGRHFVKTIVRLMRERKTVEVVDDQKGAPTYTGDLAAFTAEMLEMKAPFGTYHYTNEGETTWYGMACEIQHLLQLDTCRLQNIPSDRLKRPAKRPANSRMDLEKARRAVGHGFRYWSEALKTYLAEEPL